MRTALVALLLAAWLPAGVCEAVCAKPAPPPCHGAPTDSGHDATGCSNCEQPATLSGVEIGGAVGSVPAAGFAVTAPPARPLALRVPAPRDPPGHHRQPYAQSNRPLLS